MAEQSKTSGSYQYSALRQQTNIRLLYLEPGQDNNCIHLTLEEQDTADSFSSGASYQGLPYYALSYVWGDSRDKRSIRVDKKRFDITKNLNRFLQHARHPHERQGPYWIDAICINQTDYEEKNVQVNMMDKIYRNTEQCVVWLGLEEDNSHLAFELFQGVEDRVQDMVRTYRSRLSADDRGMTHNVGSILGSRELFSQLVNKNNYNLEGQLAAAPWWGPLHAPFPPPLHSEAWQAAADLFMRPWFQRSWTVQEFILPSNIEFVCESRALDSWTLMTFSEVIGILFANDHGYPPVSEGSFGQAFSFCSVLCSPRYKHQEQGKRPSTMSYVAIHKRKGATDARDKIFAHLGSSGDKGFFADYTKPASQVYHEFAVANIDNLRQLFVLKQDLFSFIPDLPSWVPDWTAPRPQRSCITYGQYAMGGKCELVKARLSSDDSSLFIKGILFDTITDTRVISPAVLQSFDLNGVSDAFAKNPTVLGAFHPYSESIEEILARTLMCDLIIEGDKPPLRADPPDERSIFDLQDGYTYQTHYIEDRVLIITEGRYMGLAPTESQKGDVVCVFEGLEMPWVMRWRDVCWEMVGACYCHGIMDGELKAEVVVGKRVMQEFEIR